MTAKKANPAKRGRKPISNDVRTLRNISVMGRKAREQQKATRLQEWGIIVDILGRRSFSTTAHLIRYAQRRALGIPN
jgi:hypothetical protein